MTSNTFWTLFCETGDIAYYLLYQESLRDENADQIKTA